MLIYNVTVKLHQSIQEEWVRWMKEVHMPEITGTGLFTDSRLCRLLDQDESDGVTYVAQYYCDSRDDYNDFMKTHASVMRDKNFKKFGDKFIAFRTLMQVES